VITLLIGGTRSGKSEVGERLAAATGRPVTVVVPDLPVSDPEFAQRIEVHRSRRPPDWCTVECGPGLVEALGVADGTVLVDSIGSWVASTEDFAVDVGALVAALRARGGDTIVVSEEVGLAVHAPTEVGRRFTDVLGAVNTAVAAVADAVFLVVAGRRVRLER